MAHPNLSFLLGASAPVTQCLCGILSPTWLPSLSPSVSHKNPHTFQCLMGTFLCGPSMSYMGLCACPLPTWVSFCVPLMSPVNNSMCLFSVQFEPVFSFCLMWLPLCTHPLSHVDIPVGPSRVACGPMNTPSAMKTLLVVPNVKAAGPGG